jgi:glycosyltransferase involved in cell wall biosynthesis
MDLSILIPARNERFLARTIEDILANIRGETEVIAVLDGAWADPCIKDHPRVTLVHHSVSIGQRAATNEAARISQAKYICKMDAHCAVDEGFDVKMMAECPDDETTVIPRMYNLHAFDWVCPKCGLRTYQCPTPSKCEVLDGDGKVIGGCGATGHVRDIIWKPRLNRRSDFMRFDKDLVFQYWRDYEKRSEAKGEVVDLMSSIGACWMMTRRRYRRIGGVDEKHGSWGQMGTEISCKSHLSGGRHVINKKTWFGHMFRTQGGDFGFPYRISTKDQEKAREYSRWLWQGGNWKHAVRQLSFIIDKFAPVPTWEQAVAGPLMTSSKAG